MEKEQGLGNNRGGLERNSRACFKMPVEEVRVQSYTRNHDLRLRTFFCTDSPTSGE